MKIAVLSSDMFNDSFKILLIVLCLVILCFFVGEGIVFSGCPSAAFVHSFGCYSAVPHDGTTVRALDLRSTGCGFKSYSGQKLSNNPGQVVHTYVPLSPSSITWYQPTVVMLCGWMVTAGLAESNGSLLQGGWLKSPAGWLPVYRDELWAQRLVTSMGNLYLLLHHNCR